MDVSLKAVYFQICLVVVVVQTCYSLCHYPCNFIENKRYTDGQVIFEYSCQNTSEALVLDKNGDIIGKEICIERSGSFIVLKLEPDDLYNCFLDTVVDKKSRVLKAFGTELKHFDSEPDICMACTAPYYEATFVSGEKLRSSAFQRPHPPLLCTRPGFCPESENLDDIPCAGGEYRLLSNSESCCKDGKLRRRKSRSNSYTYGYRV